MVPTDVLEDDRSEVHRSEWFNHAWVDTARAPCTQVFSFAANWRMIGSKSGLTDRCQLYGTTCLFEMVGSRGSLRLNHLKAVVLLNYVRDVILSDNEGK